MPAYKYTGQGDYLHGIPARDLEEEDLDALKGTFTESAENDDDGNAIRTRDATRKTIEASGLYKRSDTKKD